MLRLFAALAVPEDVAVALSGRQRDLEGARWRPLEALHITLRFFGEIPENQADDLDAELGCITGRPLQIQLEGVGAFGEGRDIHAIWAGVSESAELRQLAGRCEAAARRAGLAPDRRNYRPHVTLAYLSRPDPPAVAAWIQTHNLLKSPGFSVAGFGLYSSHRGDSGPAYRLEKDYPLI
ncbi:RNA 2',3'-cyclic phosphodiesterase [Phenylobacterium sp.]|uniref:RNA 2',3'-cyclic phosphodiesterase n=1 Tax=Phenylobacterium sp. TaxID=1871053 RepID=UPI00272F5E06|nr:RNA 2',3'-cyclic phosphodiesterase [Phenylobacterium sp.]MDP1872659.1 RNA 2',3'-cyclic phosphodiesterase [Phenylobacterium sp.]MDP3299275.1 RNA 2',3'-cyclic phosphodiesterase [Phenylobacterium sp.]